MADVGNEDLIRRMCYLLVVLAGSGEKGSHIVIEFWCGSFGTVVASIDRQPLLNIDEQ